MTTRATLLQLRDRLKTATGPSRELDTDLACALAGFERHPTIWCSVRRVGEVGWSETLRDVPAFTASIDGAETLVPDGLWYLSCTGRVREDEPLYAVAFNLPDMSADALTEVASAEHAFNMPLCFCLARIEYELARSPA